MSLIRATAFVAGLVLATALHLICAAAVQAGATSPALVLSSAAGEALDGAHAAVFEGSLDFENAVQLGYTLELVVFQGSRFARFPVAGTPQAGSSALLADGVLADGEAVALLGQGAPVATGVRVVSRTAQSIRVTLPADFASGDTTAVLVAVLPEHPTLSNPITFVLP